MNANKDKTFNCIYEQMRSEIVNDLSGSNIPLNDVASLAEMTSEEVSELLDPTSNRGDYLAYRTLNSAVKKLIPNNANKTNKR